MNWKKIAILTLICLLAAGLILPVSFIVSLFDESVGIYEIHNNGNWYNFGYVIGASFMFGSVLASKKGRR
jgi:hypothetical protein